MDFRRMTEVEDQTVLVPIIKPTVFILSVYYAIQWFSYNLTAAHLVSNDTTVTIRKYLSLIFMVSVLVFIAVLNQRITVYLEGRLARQQKDELERLTDYNHQIEHLYRDIRAFRHDYMNILISLQQGIDRNDMVSVRKTFNSVLADSGNFLQSDQFAVAELSLIDSDAIKSVLISKLHQADNKGISVNVEVIKEIGEPNFPMLDFIRVLTILLDNAIEAAAESENKWLSLSYFYDKGKTVLIIENSLSDQPDSLDQLYQRGVSSKGETRGWGLANVRELLAAHPHASLKTSARDGSFQQIIEIGDTI
ncbi:sensor histidine kinase [Streptococcus dentasini]